MSNLYRTKVDLTSAFPAGTICERAPAPTADIWETRHLYKFPNPMWPEQDLFCRLEDWEVEKVQEPTTITATSADAVNSPPHYQFFPGVEAIEIIATAMTQEQFHGYCLGNALKYRLRAGAKDALEQDIAKAKKYTELYEKYKEFCCDATK